MTSEKSVLFTVQAAAQQAGISPHTLRTWESRYNVVTPVRTESGHRRYRQADVFRLTQISALVRKGHSIGSVAALSVEELAGFLRENSSPDNFGESEDRYHFRSLEKHIQIRVDEIEHHVLHFRPARLAAELKWLRIVLGVRPFIFQVAVPLFRFLGQQVASGKVDIGMEHAFSAVIRDQVGAMFHSIQANPAPAANQSEGGAFIFSTPSGDHHEFGILLGAALAASYDLQVWYAGANLPAESLASTSSTFKVGHIVLGNTAIPPAGRNQSFKEYLLELDSMVPKNVAIWVGGNGDRPIASLPTRREFRYLNSVEALDDLLRKLTI